MVANAWMGAFCGDKTGFSRPNNDPILENQPFIHISYFKKY